MQFGARRRQVDAQFLGATPRRRCSAPLPAGRPMCCAAGEASAGASSPAAGRAARSGARRWGRPAHEQTQRPVVGTLALALAQHVRIDRAKDRAAGGINHGDDDLGAARSVKHESIELRAAVRHCHQLACACRVHTDELRRRRGGPTTHRFGAGDTWPAGRRRIVPARSRSGRFHRPTKTTPSSLTNDRECTSLRSAQETAPSSPRRERKCGSSPMATPPGAASGDGCAPQQADDGGRTRDLRLGKPTLYQLSYVRARAILPAGPGSRSMAPFPRIWGQTSQLSRPRHPATPRPREAQLPSSRARKRRVSGLAGALKICSGLPRSTTRPSWR